MLTRTPSCSNQSLSSLAKIPGNFAREDGDWLERLGVLVDIVMESPLEVAQTLPKFDGVVRV